MKRAVKHGRALASRSYPQRRADIAEDLRQFKERRAGERDAARDPAQVLRARVEDTTVAALRRYAPGNFAGCVSLFLPNQEWLRSGDEPLRWRSVARSSEEYFGPSGCDGDRMLREPHAAAFAELFRQCRERHVTP
jgi:hypothetical protein